jgi:hypothetical protein
MRRGEPHGGRARRCSEGRAARAQRESNSTDGADRSVWRTRLHAATSPDDALVTPPGRYEARSPVSSASSVPSGCSQRSFRGPARGPRINSERSASARSALLSRCCSSASIRVRHERRAVPFPPPFPASHMKTDRPRQRPHAVAAGGRTLVRAAVRYGRRRVGDTRATLRSAIGRVVRSVMRDPAGNAASISPRVYV